MRRKYPWWTPLPIALAWCAAGVVVALTVPLYWSTGPGARTLVGVNGAGTLWPFGACAALCLFCWAGLAEWRRRRHAATRVLVWVAVGVLGFLALAGVLDGIVFVVAAPAAGLCGLGANRATVGLLPRGSATHGPTQG